MKKYLFLSCLCCLSFCLYGQQKYCLNAGTKISIVLQDKISSQTANPGYIKAKIAADIYDEEGNKILINKGAPVNLQVKIRKATVFGEQGMIELIPISTTAYNGRDVTFDNEAVCFYGNEDALFSRKKKVVVTEGTSFIATIANTTCFKD